MSCRLFPALFEWSSMSPLRLCALILKHLTSHYFTTLISLMASNSSKHENSPSPPSEQVEKPRKAIRHPRWTRNETLVLIEGKKAIENVIQFQRGRRSSAALGADPVEPKWDLISSFCRERGVIRGPVQCRKRWSNLLVDFKKIRNYELRVEAEQAESFWAMRNDLRREKKLPGFFDREVYDVMDGKDVGDASAFPLTVMYPMPISSMHIEDVEIASSEEEEDEKTIDDVRDDSNEDGVFSDFEECGQEETATNIIKEENVTMSPTNPGYVNGKRALRPNGRCDDQEKRKQRRLSVDGSENNCTDKLIKAMEKNSRMITAQLEAHNKNSRFEREQSKEQHDNLLAAIKDITDALVRIVDALSSEKA